MAKMAMAQLWLQPRRAAERRDAPQGAALLPTYSTRGPSAGGTGLGKTARWVGAKI
jgi:hypothetical protein